MKLLCLLPLLILAAVFAFALPPHQTADMLGMLCALCAHLGAAAGLLWINKPENGLLARVGWSVTLSFYWLSAVGTALLWRIFSFSACRALFLLELTLTAVAAGFLWCFWLARGLDQSKRGGKDER